MTSTTSKSGFPIDTLTLSGPVKPRVARVINQMAGWPGLGSVIFLTLELRQTLQEKRRTAQHTVDGVFRNKVDPFSYISNPQEQERFAIQRELLDGCRVGATFRSALEIGPGEGIFTEILATRSDSLLVVDLAPTALQRTQDRRGWGAHVRFALWNLLSDELPGQFDLVVATGLLEYFTRRRTLSDVREKLVDALKDGGYLLLESTRAQPVVEHAWWGRALIRGKWINDYVAAHPALSVERHVLTEPFAITLLRKTSAGT